MKGIMRKRLLALLSAAGLAGTASSGAGQALKGSQPSNKTTAESKMKYNKAQQEKSAAASGAAYKERKAGGEQQAAKDVVNEKVGPDHVAHKHLAGVKYEDAASKDAAKMTKAKNEKTAAANAAAYKEHKAGAQHDAITVKQKVGENATLQRKAGGSQQEDATTAGKIKLEKSAAESDASKKAATIKLTKGAAGANAAHSEAVKKVDQASPGKKVNQASPK